jgi:hypothetical protein
MRAKLIHLLLILTLSFALTGCSSNSDASHTTATNYVSPPPHQALTVVPLTVKTTLPETDIDPTADPTRPLLIFGLVDGTKFRVGEAVPVNFSVKNAKLKSDGGEFRVRYIVDDQEMQWVDKAESFALAGWVAGEHTIRIELVGPDEWPFRNGNANIVTRKIVVTP